MLTDDEIRALLEGTEGVTPGPWSVYREHDVGDGSGHLFGCEFPDDAAHIARCDPTTIAELCTRLLSAEAKVKELEKAERAAYERGRQDASPTLGISPLR
jgi:hypothetical protein